MPKKTLKKQKWTLSFNPSLKSLVVREAKKKGIYPVSLLESIVRERYNPYGHSEIKDSTAYVKNLRKFSETQSDEDFLQEIREWQKSKS
jgi:hypothetical protein